MSSVEDADRRAKYAVVPKRASDGKIVKLEPKKLKTERMVRTVLPEEKYLDNLDKIIQRDYFPELPKLKAQNDYLEAQQRNDIAKMRELQLQFKTQRRTERRTSPGKAAFAETPEVAASPAVFDPDTPGPSKRSPDANKAGEADDDDVIPIPGANPEGDNEITKKKSELDNLSVDGYLNKFTSEDNASFEELSALMGERHRNKIGWMYKAEEEHNKEKITRGNAILSNADEQLAIRYDVESMKDKPKELDNWAYTAHNHVLFHPTDAALTEEEKRQQALRNQREINKNATRFPSHVKMLPSEASMARAAFSQAAQLAGKVDALGNELGVVKSGTLGMVATPSPAPGVDDTPFITWGEIDGTPFRLDAADVELSNSAAPSFKMPSLPAREMLAQSISETIANRYKDKRKVAMHKLVAAHKTVRMGSPASHLSISSLSPAARLLMKNNKLGIGVRASPSSPALTARSPALTRRPAASPSTPSLTDNLLKVAFPSPSSHSPRPSTSTASSSSFAPAEKERKRATAGDFF